MRNSTRHAMQAYDNRPTEVTEARRKVMEAYRERARVKERNARIAQYCAWGLFGLLALEACYIAGWV